MQSYLDILALMLPFLPLYLPILAMNILIYPLSLIPFADSIKNILFAYLPLFYNVNFIFAKLIDLGKIYLINLAKRGYCNASVCVCVSVFCVSTALFHANTKIMWIHYDLIIR